MTSQSPIPFYLICFIYLKILISMNKLIANCLLFLCLGSLSSLESVAANIKETPQEYPPEYTQKYLRDCQATSRKEGLAEIESKKLCNCTLREFQKQYSLVEFKQLNVTAQNDRNASDKLIEVGQFCFEELLYE